MSDEEGPFTIIDEDDGWFRIVTLSDVRFVWMPEKRTSKEVVVMVRNAMNLAFEIGERIGAYEARMAIRRAIGL